QGDRAADGPEQACQRLQQGGLPGPVAAEDDEQFPRPNGHRDAGEDCPPAIAAAQLGRGEHHEPPCQRLAQERCSATRKNGPPSNAVTTPMGSSSGGARQRARASAPSTRTAPPRPLAGTRRACAAPTSGRARCGAARPTKPITPPAATAVATARLAAASTSAVAPPTHSPRARALSSPPQRASSGRPSRHRTMVPARSGGQEATLSPPGPAH